MPTYGSNTTSYNARVGELGDPSTITVQKAIWRLDGAAIDLDNEISAIEAEGHLPVYNNVWAGFSAGMTWEQFARCRSISYSSDQRSLALSATIVYSTLYYLNPAWSPAQYALPVSTEYASKSRVVRIFRQSWSIAPSYSVIGTDSSADIGGTAMDGGQISTSMELGQIVVRIRKTLDASADPMNAMYAKFSTIINKRNSIAFGRFPISSLVCESVTMQKAQAGFEFYDVVFELLYDPWHHYEQVADTGEDLLPKLNGLFQPTTVKWKRPSLELYDFNPVIFPNGSGGTLDVERDLTLEGWWY